MTEYTLDTLPLHALHSSSANLLATWYGILCSDEELAKARLERPLGSYYVIVEIAPSRVRVAEIKETIAEARSRVAANAPFARVATLRHDAAEHDEWPGSADGVTIGAELPMALFDWTR